MTLRRLACVAVVGALLAAGCADQAAEPGGSPGSLSTATSSASAPSTPTEPQLSAAPTPTGRPGVRGLTQELRWSTGAQPKQVAFTPDGTEVWTSLLGGNGVEIYDAATGERLGGVTLGQHGAVEVIFTRDGGTAYVSQMETASVFEVDTATRTVRRQIFGKGVWSKVMALSPDERTLYLANWSSDNVSDIDLETGTVRRLIPTVTTPRGLYVSPDGSRLYVAGYADGELQVIDLDDSDDHGRVLIRTGGAMRHLVGDPAGTRVYASDMAASAVYVVDLSNHAVTRLAQVDPLPNTIDISPDGRVLFVSSRGRNGADYLLPGPQWGSVLAIDTETGRVLAAIEAGDQTTGLDLSADGARLAFSDFLDGRISIYAVPATDTLLETELSAEELAEHRARLEKGGA